jgi:ribosomal protein L11 methyltransferase
VRVPADEAESATAWLLERFPAGLEERRLGPTVELAAFTDDLREAEIRAAFADVSSTEVEPGWQDRWKMFHRPVRAGGLWIGPPWIDAPSAERSVVVDPGRAFGTGAHPTTRACIEALSRLERGSVLDAGCGSGVVAVAAARLGFGPVHAVDLDDVAVEVAADTARSNGVDVQVWQADVLADDLPETEVLVANIDVAVVERLLERAQSRTAVTSGYFTSDRPRSTRWESVDRVEVEGWAADVFARPH